MSDKQVVIIGAGPAGLTAAYELAKSNVRPIVLEQLDKVGGLARTEDYKGYYFDMGGHRFFTKAAEANQLWHEALGNGLLRRPRLSRIYYNNRFFDYPLKPFNALFGLGIWASLCVIISFIRWQIFPHKQQDNIEQWVTNRFGRRLFTTFFKTYTEKVWGIPCTELKAEWAAQRIRGLSMKTALLAMFVKPKDTVRTLIDEFEYPRFGPGMLWNAFKSEIERRRGVVRLNSEVVKIERLGNRIESVTVSSNGSGREIIRGTDFISSMPIAEFIKKLDPVPDEILQAAENLMYRDFLTVCLIVNKANLFPDNWIYIHSPEVKVGRIQNFKNWSPDMVPDPSKTSLGLEYFCTEGDELWTMPNAELIEQAKREVERIGLARCEDVEDGCVFRVPKAYPVYNGSYRQYLDVVKEFLHGLENFQTIGRNGLHRYNNMDHSMVTGLLAVRNVLEGEKNDVWSVNTDQEYHEEVRGEVGVERTDLAALPEGALVKVFSRLDPVALGASIGVMGGMLLFLVTIALLVKGGEVVGPNLQLLDQFFPWYSVTAPGSLVGLLYGFVVGFIGGWGFAFLRNLAVFLSAVIFQRQLEFHMLWKLHDFTRY